VSRPERLEDDVLASWLAGHPAWILENDHLVRELRTVDYPSGVAIVAAQVDLGAASRIVSIGRGLKAQTDLGLVEALAKAADAELSCSRPIAEGMEWLPKDRYVGISGQHVAPDLYMAIGISGQLQHMVGVRGAKTIVAINSDAEAPVFHDADYGIVGDLYEIVPAITQALAT